MAMALGRGHEAPAGSGGCCWLPGGPSSVLSTRFSQQEQGRRAAPAPRCCNAGHEAARGRAGAEAPRVWAGKGAALPDESVPPGARGILGLRRALGWDFFLLFFFVFPVESSNLSPAFWDPGGTVETPCGQALGGDGSAGRCGRRRPAPLGNSSPTSRAEAATPRLHFPSRPGPAPHPPAGSRRCKSWAKAPGGKGGRGCHGPARAVFQPCCPPGADGAWAP